MGVNCAHCMKFHRSGVKAGIITYGINEKCNKPFGLELNSKT